MRTVINPYNSDITERGRQQGYTELFLKQGLLVTYESSPDDNKNNR